MKSNNNFPVLGKYRDGANFVLQHLDILYLCVTMYVSQIAAALLIEQGRAQHFREGYRSYILFL